MAHWNMTINLKDAFSERDMSFQDRKSIVVERITNSGWLDNSLDGETLRDLVMYLSESSDTSEFDYWWNQVYDIADVDRIWLATF